MWVWSHGEATYHLFPSEFIIGRDKSHVLNMDGKSISRNHVQLIIDKDDSKCEIVSIKKPRIDTGVYVNGLQLKSEERFSIDRSTTYRVQVGRKEDSYFTLKWRPLSFSYHEDEEETLLNEIIKGSDIRMQRYFSEDTTHYVKGKKNSSKLLLAMIKGVYVVGQQFLNELLNRKNEGLAVIWPDESDYVPEPELAIDTSRIQLWAGMTFAFSDRQQLEMLGPVITEGDGKAICLYLEDDTSTTRTIVDDLQRHAGKKVVVRSHEKKYQQIIMDAMGELANKDIIVIDAADLLPAVKECNPSILWHKAQSLSKNIPRPKVERLDTVLMPPEKPENKKPSKPASRPAVNRVKRAPPKQMDLLNFFVKEETDSPPQPEITSSQDKQSQPPSSKGSSQRRPLKQRARVEPIDNLLLFQQPLKRQKVDNNAETEGKETADSAEELVIDDADIVMDNIDLHEESLISEAAPQNTHKPVDFSSAVQNIKSEHAKEEEANLDTESLAQLSIEVKEGSIAVRRPPPLQATRMMSVVNAARYDGRRNFKKFKKQLPGYAENTTHGSFSRFDRRFVALVPDKPAQSDQTSIDDMLHVGENLTDRRIRILRERGEPQKKYRALDDDGEDGAEEADDDDLFLKDSEPEEESEVQTSHAAITIDDDSEDETAFKFSK
ncbi:hypothetical protein B0I72DRAFT_115458 [Yarrowia lipolytica]|uniref:FHA domain-containing protein n=1 Tax=Yarrowia lipolytica TaxID=4952 RepID=A0A371CFQ9_YARLL|nr:hypothetical protein B0I71DRAFT_90944 [Yarrowia lipolytica]RDW31200.1 hypothetical protein B0I72DRAFT_115458 [Yarrowia lipolytica]RDW38402.1 hypothetical protein B0I73DRAFT_175937 [Yarrowia lipolytica]RDW46028.1 hypothetical protein B0I74DRAFT_173897 [Yarrowia lipolytica]RDW56243.1 hypothetical protein B0I75DRAFT_161245 [Yarrowia lipolytica]